MHAIMTEDTYGRMYNSESARVIQGFAGLIGGMLKPTPVFIRGSIPANSRAN
jgi:hypothetical protein